MKFFVLSLKRIILPFIFLLLAVCFVIFSKTNLTAAKNGLTLWANNVVPSLFPFFVMTELLSNTNIVHHIGKLFDKIMRPLFNVPGECAFAFIMGLISGYPTGGKIVADLREQGLCTKDEGDRMLAFTNNSGPLFIISCVGIALFGDTKTGILLLCTHILAGITIGILFGKLSAKNTKNSKDLSTNNMNYFSKKERHMLKETSVISKTKELKEPVTISSLGRVLGKSIQNAISTVLMIGGFVVIFSVIISILEQSHLLDMASQFLKPILSIFGFSADFAKPVLSGMIELTNGVSRVAGISIKAISQNVILCAFLLGFGGFSVLFQVFSLLSKTDLSMKKYLIGKLLQGIVASIYTFLALKFIPTLNLDIAPTFAPIADTIIYPINFLGINNYVLLLFVILFIVCAAFSHQPKKKGVR